LRFHDIAIPSSIEICTAILAGDLTSVNAAASALLDGPRRPRQARPAERTAGASERQRQHASSPRQLLAGGLPTRRQPRRFRK
jgi:hypothetical protein